MEAYKLGKMIKNQNLDLNLAFDKFKDTKEELKKSLKRRNEMAIQKNDTQYNEESIKDLCDEGRFSEPNAKIENLLEKNNILNEGVRELKREHEIHLVRLCEITKQKKQVEEDVARVDEENM